MTMVMVMLVMLSLETDDDSSFFCADFIVMVVKIVCVMLVTHGCNSHGGHSDDSHDNARDGDGHHDCEYSCYYDHHSSGANDGCVTYGLDDFHDTGHDDGCNAHGGSCFIPI
jgi:hypothetical protein